MSASTIPPCFLRDLSEGLQQQMFFWGQDVQRPTGNFLKEQGFERGPSKGAKGTSCYRLPWQGGHVELYGACVGWYGAEGGFTFIRPRRRCFIWESGEETPVPGAWQVGLLKPASGRELYEASVPFLDWLLAYEDAVLARFGSAYRDENYLSYRKVPKAKQWVEPAAALQWFRGLRDSPGEVKRPKFYIQGAHA
jgi:hypothetical protein